MDTRVLLNYSPNTNKEAVNKEYVDNLISNAKNETLEEANTLINNKIIYGTEYLSDNSALENGQIYIVYEE